MEGQLGVGDVVRVPFVTMSWSVGDALTILEEYWRYTNNTELPLRLRNDGALVTFPRGKARLFARPQRQTNWKKESTGHLTIFNDRQIQSTESLAKDEASLHVGATTFKRRMY